MFDLKTPFTNILHSKDYLWQRSLFFFILDLIAHFYEIFGSKVWFMAEEKFIFRCVTYRHSLGIVHTKYDSWRRSFFCCCLHTRPIHTLLRNFGIKVWFFAEKFSFRYDLWTKFKDVLYSMYDFWLDTRP